MSPQPSIAHYRIGAKLGEGGMGEVYRATDTKLNREVAIKVLPESFAADPDRMARFQREAQVLASLNHPNIAAIYGVEERALVMELVEGGEPRGPLAEAQALPIVQQLIDALEYAHERGVVHRDLKPANIKVTPEGKVKILDFGLAKAMSQDPQAEAWGTTPTLTMRATLAGTIMGTAAYMAPEQARGQNVDKRADIWAFGVVVYELLTGKQLFPGATVSDTLAAVLRQEIDPAAVPERFRGLLGACLERDPRRRLRDIGDARRLLEETDHSLTVVARNPLPAPSSHGWRIAAALLALAAAGASWMAWRATRPVDRPLIRFSVDLGPEALPGAHITVVLSPDGARMVFPFHNAQGNTQLATRTLDQAHPTLLAGTEDGVDPFFSPDGQWIGFFAGGKMKKISVLGGAAVPLCSASGPRGASWGEDGSIVFTPTISSGLARVPEAGGAPQMLTDPPKVGEVSHRWPQILPGGQAVLFTSTANAANYEEAKLDVVSLKTGRVTTVHAGGYFGRYLPSGHLVFVHQGVLFAILFDPLTLKTRGAPAPVQDEIASNPVAGAGQFDFSRAGMFAYVSGKGQSQASIALVDSAGDAKSIQAAARLYLTPRFSPDGVRMVFSANSGGQAELWLYDFQRQTTTQLTFNAKSARSPVWTPDGKHIALGAHSSNGGYDIWWVRSDGAGEPQVLLEGKTAVLFPSSFSPDGKRLAYYDSTQGGWKISVLPLDIADPDHPKAGTPEPFLQTAGAEIEPAFSPDGRWIAYASDEDGPSEIYVRPYRPGGSASSGKWRISTGGGRNPIWSRDGRQLFFLAGDDRLMVVDCASQGDSFERANPRRWSDRRFVDLIQAPMRTVDLAPDGKHIASVEYGGASSPQGPLQITFLMNFFDELKRRAP